MKWNIFILLLIVIPAPLFGMDRACVMPGQGYFRIHVGTAGLFGAFAHDHLIEAEKIMGCATVDSKDVTHSSAKLDFPGAGLRVTDPKEKPADRAEGLPPVPFSAMIHPSFTRLALATCWCLCAHAKGLGGTVFNRSC